MPEKDGKKDAKKSKKEHIPPLKLKVTLNFGKGRMLESFLQGWEDDKKKKEEEEEEKEEIKENVQKKPKIIVKPLRRIPDIDLLSSKESKERSRSKSENSRQRKARESKEKKRKNKKTTLEADDDDEEEEFEENIQNEDNLSIRRSSRRKRKKFNFLESDEEGEMEEISDSEDLSQFEKLEEEFPPEEEEFLSLPMGPKPKKLTEEESFRKAEMAKRRRQQAEEQNEAEKMEVLRKLLNPQQTKKRNKEKEEELAAKLHKQIYKDDEVIRLTINSEGSFVSFPKGISIPDVIQQSPKEWKPPHIRCAAPGCDNLKIYTCSKTRLPLCSFECFKKVQQSVSQQKEINYELN